MDSSLFFTSIISFSPKCIVSSDINCFYFLISVCISVLCLKDYIHLVDKCP